MQYTTIELFRSAKASPNLQSVLLAPRSVLVVCLPSVAFYTSCLLPSFCVFLCVSGVDLLDVREGTLPPFVSIPTRLHVPWRRDCRRIAMYLSPALT